MRRGAVGAEDTKLVDGLSPGNLVVCDPASWCCFPVVLAGVETSVPGKSISVGQVYGDTYWEKRLAAARAFHTAHDRWPDRASDDPDEHRLAVWLATQKIMWRAGCLPAQRQQALSAAGVRLEPNRTPAGRDAHWVARLAELQAFRTLHGRWPAESNDDPAAHSLAVWLSKQRALCRTGRISGYRYQALIDAGVELNPGKPHWETRLAELQDFRAVHNRWPALASENLVEQSLARWLKMQYWLYKTGRLSGQRRQALDDAGAAPGGKEPVPVVADTCWCDRLAQVVAYQTRYGRWPSTTLGDHQEAVDAVWLIHQRAAARQGRLPEPHRQALIEAGVDLNPLDTRWDARMAELKAFRATCNRWPTKTSPNPAERQLAAWLAYQQKNPRPGRRQTLLDAGVKIGPPPKRQGRRKHPDEWLAELETFHTTQQRWPVITSDDTAERRLGCWVNNQRIAYRAGRMSQQQQQALTRLGVDLAPNRGQVRKENHWATRLAELLAFHAARHRWPVKNFNNPDEQHLWVWLSNQRTAYRAGKMPEHRSQALLDAGVRLVPG